MPRIGIHIDFETRSAVNLKKSSTYDYARDPSTDAWCMAYAVADGEVKIWKMGQPFPEGLAWALKANDTYFVAHNAQFELTIWNELMVKRHGWPPLPAERTYCTMAMAYAMSLPASLENAASALNMTERKNLDGRRLMMKMAVPKATLPDGTHLWHDDAASLAILYDYCKQDVTVERELEKRMVPLRGRERDVWLLDQTINNRGVYVDVPTIKKALETIETEKDRLDIAMRIATSGYVQSVRDVSNLTAFVEIVTGKPCDSADKATVRELLATDLPKDVREALELRKEGAKSSTAKLQAMLEGASSDNRVRQIFQYHGAGTGRWAGRRMQPQNMPRPDMSQQEIELAIQNIGDPEMLTLLFDKPPLTILSNCLRSMIKAAPGNMLISADYANIEGRMLAWLAGQDDKLDLFRAYDEGTGEDLYKITAGSILDKPAKDVTKLERQEIGKVSELALGFGGGVGAFNNMAAAYGVNIATAYEPVTKGATEEQLRKARVLYKGYLTRNKLIIDSDDIMRTFITADLIKQKWRATYSAIAAYWLALEDAAMQALRCPGEMFAAGPRDHREVRFKKSGSFLQCRLPSGRHLIYPFAKIEMLKPIWSEEDDETLRPTITYMGVDSKTRSWKTQKAYGGMLAENVTQAAARDVLVDGMFAAEAAGYPVVMHVHDEIVAEINGTFDSEQQKKDLVKLFEKIITCTGDWADGCPIVAEGWIGERYRK